VEREKRGAGYGRKMFRIRVAVLQNIAIKGDRDRNYDNGEEAQEGKRAKTSNDFLILAKATGLLKRRSLGAKKPSGGPKEQFTNRCGSS